MKTTFEVVLVLVSVWAGFYAIWWRLLRPTILLRLRYMIYEARDNIREMVIESQVKEDHEAIVILEQACVRALNVISRINILDVALMSPSRENMMRAERDLALMEASGQKIRAIHMRVIHALLGALFINSPGLFPLFGLVGLCMIASYWFTRVKTAVERRAVAAWALIYSSTQPC